MSDPTEPQLVALHADGAPAGVVGKVAAHQPPGVRHLAVSVVVLSPDDRQVLLQRRAASKYHFAGLWANSACTHPGEGETLFAAGRRCLDDELGIGGTVGPLEVRGAFWYRADDPRSGLVEHELDVVLRCRSRVDLPLEPTDVEVSETVWAPLEDVVRDAEDRSRYVPWLAGVLRTDAEGGGPAGWPAVTGRIDEHAARRAV